MFASVPDVLPVQDKSLYDPDAFVMILDVIPQPNNNPKYLLICLKLKLDF